MGTETIEVFTYSIREKRAKEKYSFAEGIDLYEMMKKDFIDFIHNSQTGDVPSEKRTVRVPKANGKYPFWGVNDDLRCVYGVIETGLYGKKIEVVNKDNPTAPLFEADDKNAAVIKPFFFLVKIPKAGDVGYMIFERTDNESIATLFVTIFQAYLKNIVADNESKGFMIDRENYVTKEYVNALKSGRLKSMTFRLRKVPKDIADRYMMKGLGVDTSITMTVNFQGGITKPNVTKAIMDEKQLFTTTDGILGDIVASDRSVVTDAKINGQMKERTIYLDDKNNSLIRPYYLIDVTIDERGYPSFESLKSSVLKFINDNQELKTVIA